MEPSANLPVQDIPLNEGLKSEEDKSQPSYSAVTKKSRPIPATPKSTPAPSKPQDPAPASSASPAAPSQPQSSSSTPTQPNKSSGGFYSFLKR